MVDGAGETHAQVPGEEAEELRARLMDLEGKSRRRPDDLEILKEQVGICERLGEEEEASEYRRKICRIDPGEPSIQGKKIAQRRPLVKSPEGLQRPIKQDLPRLVRYPFEGLGRTIFAGGVVYFGAGRWFASEVTGRMPFPISIFFSAFVLILAWGVILAYWLKVAERSAQGEEEPPDWADFRDFFHSMVSPCFATIGCFLVTLGPAVAWFRLSETTFGFGAASIAVLLLLLAAGGLAAPMTFLVLARFQRFSAAMRPGFVSRAIRTTFQDYISLVVIQGVLAVVGVALATPLGLVCLVPLLGPVVYFLATSFIGLYLGMIAFHLLGRFYLRHAKELNWFDEVLETAGGGEEVP